MRLGPVEINPTFVFQLLNTALLLVIFIGIPIYVVRHMKSMHKRLERLEKTVQTSSDKAPKED